MDKFKVTQTDNAPSAGPQPEPIPLEMGKPKVIRTYGSDLTMADFRPARHTFRKPAK